MVVLDTNIVVSYLKGNKDVIEAVDLYPKAAITFITVYELLKYRGKKGFLILEEILDKFYIYQSDNKSAVIAADIYKELEEKGKMINENDILLIGICTANNEILITKDRDFANISNKRIVILPDTF